jgi:hypothetical protein
MEKAAFSAGIPARDDLKTTVRAARLARLRVIGRAEGVAQREIDAAEASLAGAYALADFVDAIRGLGDD